MKEETKSYIKYLFVDKGFTNIYAIVSLIFIKELETGQWGKLYAMVFKETQRLNSELRNKK